VVVVVVVASRLLLGQDWVLATAATTAAVGVEAAAMGKAWHAL
jgi:hypothetical protein